MNSLFTIPTLSLLALGVVFAWCAFVELSGQSERRPTLLILEGVSGGLGGQNPFAAQIRSAGWVNALSSVLVGAGVVGQIGLLAATSQHPGRPLRALAAGIWMALRRPLTIVAVLAAQATLLLGAALLSGDPVAEAFTYANSSLLGFQLWANGAFHLGASLDGIVTSAIAMLTAPLFLAAYWSAGAPLPEPRPVKWTRETPTPQPRT